MTIHDVIIQHEDTRLEWKLDDDYLIYMHVCAALVTELIPVKEGRRNVNVSMAGILRSTGMVCHKVHDDHSLYNLFVRNNPEHPITLVVSLEVEEDYSDYEEDEVQVLERRSAVTLVEIDEEDVEEKGQGLSVVPYIGSRDIVKHSEEQEKGVLQMGLDDYDGGFDEELNVEVNECGEAKGNVHDVAADVNEYGEAVNEAEGNVDDVVADVNEYGEAVNEAEGNVDDVVADVNKATLNVEDEAADVNEDEAIDTSESGSEDDPMWAPKESDEESGWDDDSFIVNSDEDQAEVEAAINEDEIGFPRQRINSEIRDEEEIPTVNVKRKRRKVEPSRIPLYDASGKVQLSLHQLFTNHSQFREILRTYAIEQGFEYRMVKCAKTRMTYRCAAEGCIWRIHASRSPCRTQFMIKSFMEKHTCQEVRRNRCVSSSWIAKVLVADFQEDPNLSLSKIRYKMKEQFGITDIPNSKLFRARVMARGGVFEAHEEQFSLLRCYANMILSTNPGSMAIIEADSSGRPPHFRRLFVCLDACRRGFIQGCRPVIGIDGCHLKGPFGGVLLCAISLEANLGWFPVAYGIFEQEKTTSWEWFLGLLREAVGRDIDTKPWCIISDRQKGLVQAVQKILPMCTHRNCCHHIWKNLLCLCKETGLKDLFWEAAKAPNVHEFEFAMHKMRVSHPNAHAYLQVLEPHTWAFHAMDSRVKCEHITSNFLKSFNAWIAKERFKPPITMLELIRSKIMDLIYTRAQIASRWEQPLTPDVSAKIRLLNRVTRHAQVLRSGAYEFEVDLNNQKVAVRLDDNYCDCGAWELRGIPCVHALACISTIRSDVSDYCSTYFTTERWRATFAAVVHPIRSRNYWPEFPPETMLQPPVTCNRVGRPSKHRSRAKNERRPVSTRAMRNTCTNCGLKGHNKRRFTQQLSTSKGSQQAPVQEEATFGTQEAEVPQSQLSQL